MNKSKHPKIHCAACHHCRKVKMAPRDQNTSSIQMKPPARASNHSNHYRDEKLLNNFWHLCLKKKKKLELLKERDATQRSEKWNKSSCLRSICKCAGEKSGRDVEH